MLEKVRETVSVMLLAARYSFGFCWRSAPMDTFWRLIISMGTSVSGYLIVFSTGMIVNAVQRSVSTHKTGIKTWAEISESGLVHATLFLLIVAIFSVVCHKAHSFFSQKSNHILHYANQRELEVHKATLDVARFRSKEYDDLTKRIQELPWAWKTRIFFANEMLNLFVMLVAFVLYGIALTWQQPLYAVILIGTALPMIFIEFKTVGLWWNLFEELVPHNKERSVLERPFTRVVAFAQALMFNQMPTLRKEIDINVGHVMEKYNEIRWVTLKRGLITDFLAIIGLIVVILHAVWHTISTGGEIGTLTIIIASAKTFQSELGAIVGTVADQWNSAKGVILIEKDFLGIKPLIKTEYPVVPKWNTPPPIRFENVSFAYPDTDGKLVLDGVSFVVAPGTKVAIVGKSGNGKSTIQALLTRHYDPTSGAIFVGDVNLRNIRPEDWNTIVSALTQEYVILERPIGREIASSVLGQPIDQARVRRSAEFAQFAEVVAEKPKGYDEHIGTEFGGCEFSGGENQRLALARVHYRKTPILILDEPDAKLDPESAQKVMENIFGLTGVTVILITHHVSRADRCDHVIVMGKGKIVEQGSPQELLAQNGAFASMYQKDKERLGGSHIHTDSDSGEESD